MGYKLKRISQSEVSVWKNPYADLQYTFRYLVKEILHMNNGIVTLNQFRDVFGFRSSNEKIMNLLFDNKGDHLVWKSKIQNINKIAIKLKIPLAEVDDSIIKLFQESRSDANRRPYPYLVSSDRKQQVMVKPFGPLYRFSLLIRPMVEFNKDITKPPHYNFRVGDNEIALFIHADLDKNLEYIAGGRYFFFFFLGWNVWEQENIDIMMTNLGLVKSKAFDFFAKKQYTDFAKIIINSINESVTHNWDSSYKTELFYDNYQEDQQMMRAFPKKRNRIKE